MAKKKMTLEEKLEDTIVKEDPFKIPDNWIWTNIGSITTEIKNGTTIKQNKDKDGIKVTRIESLQNNNIDINRLGTIVDVDKIKDQDYYLKDDIALSHINSIEHVGKTVLIDKSLLPLVHGMNLLRLRFYNRVIIPQYFAYYSRGYEYKKFIVDRVNRAVNQVSLNQKNLATLPIPLPPLKEQQRIVDKIESLFEKLDNAKELIEEARDDFEKRKSAILEKAFRGELTREWRKENRKEENNKELELKDIANFKGGFAFKSTQFVDKGIQVIRMGNLYNGILDLTRNPVYIPVETDDNIISKSSIKKGDILLTLTGTKYKRDYGYAVLIDENRELLLNQRILSISPKENIVTSYLYYYLKSELFRDIFFSQETGGVNQGNVSGKFVETIKMNVVPLDEQKEIVRILDSILDEESKVEELTQLEEQIELIKKSILAKAFRGQLGTNDPEEESALELLKTILSKE